MKREAATLRWAQWCGKEKYYTIELRERGFLCGIFNATAFRLILIAVKQDQQRKGVATALIARMFEECASRGINTITLRTHKNGDALAFWLKMGAAITGEKGDDWEMTMIL